MRGASLAVRDMCQGAPASPPYNDNDVMPGWPPVQPLPPPPSALSHALTPSPADAAVMRQCVTSRRAEANKKAGFLGGDKDGQQRNLLHY